MDKSDLYKFSPDERVTVPRPIAIVIENMLKQGHTEPKLERIYEIIREENPTYQHPDNSNARKILTGRVIRGIKRKMPVTALVRIVDQLGISSGKYLQGRQMDMFETMLQEQLNANKK